jgi:hypothetical protein
MAEVDQAVVDEILAKAAEDTEEGRLEKLEKEVETLKGSIKRLLLDIRETMNKLENPFANLQSLAESNVIPSTPAQIQVVPAKLPEAGEECEAEEEKRPEERVEMEEKEKAEEKGKTQAEIPVRSPRREEIKEMAEMKTEAEFEAEKRIDPVTLFRLMEWVQSMISKHSYDSFKLMLDVFSATGYIRNETRELILKLAELAKLDGREVFIDLYRLNRILNPKDRSLDSQVLALLLEKR